MPAASTVRARVRALATFLAAAALGTCAMAGVALLLYTGQGFLRTAAFLVSLVLVSLAGGVWVGGAQLPRLANRWALLVLAFLAAGVFSSFWIRSGTLRESAFGGALAVLLILAEPAYLAGSLFVALAGRARSPTSIAAVATAGAAFGVLVAGSFLIPNLDAPLLFLASAIGLMFAGGIQSVLDAVPEETATMDMKDRVAIVTGVGHPGQVGYVVAQRLLRAGANVAITSRSGTVTAMARELGPAERIVGIAADLLSDDDVARLIEGTRERFGRLDAVVNVAGGLTVVGSVEDTSADAWRKEIERNADTTYRVSRAALPLLRERGGAIVSFASPAATRAPAKLAAYSAGKAAVVALTRSLAIEERDRGIRVNAIAPGMIDTVENRRSAANPDEVRWVSREQIADVVLFLVSDAGSGVNGEVVKVLARGVK